MLERPTIPRRAALAGIAAAALAPCAAAQDAGFEGTWSGVLSLGAGQLRLRLIIADGQATLVSLDQGSAAIPATRTTIEGDAISAAFESVRASYVARRTGDRIEGVFTQGGARPLVFVRGVVEIAPDRPAPLTQARLAALRASVAAPALAAAATNRAGAALSLVDGRRAVNAATLATTNDLWHLGSITKSMTATLIARVIETGAMRWEDSIGAVLGGPAASSPFAAATFRHLLSHTAGLQANIPAERQVSYARENPNPREERLAYALEALAQQPSGAMGASFTYSNNGYIIAGAMLEKRFEQSWENLIRARLFAPLNLTSAGFGAPGRGAPPLSQPYGHAANAAGGLDPYPADGPITDNVAALGPAGRVHMSLADLLRYAAAHRDRTSLLSAQSWRALHTPPFGGDYALGWMRRGQTSWHNGANTLWYAALMVDPARGLAACAAANDGRLDVMPDPVNQALAAAAEAVA